MKPIDWMKRAPFGPGDEIEIRQVFAAEDFGEALTPELREQEERLRAQARRNEFSRHSGAARSAELGIRRSQREIRANSRSFAPRNDNNKENPPCDS